MRDDAYPLGGESPLKLQKLLCCWKVSVSSVLLNTLTTAKWTYFQIILFNYYCPLKTLYITSHIQPHCLLTVTVTIKPNLPPEPGWQGSYLQLWKRTSQRVLHYSKAVLGLHQTVYCHSSKTTHWKSVVCWSFWTTKAFFPGMQVNITAFWLKAYALAATLSAVTCRFYYDIFGYLENYCCISQCSLSLNFLG